MTPKQERFVQEYLIDLSATQAAIRAGYSPKTASAVGWENLRKPEIEAAIQEARNKTAEKLEINRERLLKEYALMGFARSGDYLTINSDGEPFIDLSGCSQEQLAAISETQVESYVEHDPESEDPKGTRVVKKVKVKFHDKKAALDSISRILGIFEDKSTVKHEFGDLTDEELLVRARAAGLIGGAA